MNRDQLNTFGKYAHLGVTMGVSVIAFTYLGQYLDKRFDLSPLFLLLGLAWGFGGSLYYIIKVLNKDNGK